MSNNVVATLYFKFHMHVNQNVHHFQMRLPIRIQTRKCHIKQDVNNNILDRQREKINIHMKDFNM